MTPNKQLLCYVGVILAVILTLFWISWVEPSVIPTPDPAPPPNAAFLMLPSEATNQIARIDKIEYQLPLVVNTLEAHLSLLSEILERLSTLESNSLNYATRINPTNTSRLTKPNQ